MCWCHAIENKHEDEKTHSCWWGWILLIGDTFFKQSNRWKKMILLFSAWVRNSTHIFFVSHSNIHTAQMSRTIGHTQRTCGFDFKSHCSRVHDVQFSQLCSCHDKMPHCHSDTHSNRWIGILSGMQISQPMESILYCILYYTFIKSFSIALAAAKTTDFFSDSSDWTRARRNISH